MKSGVRLRTRPAFTLVELLVVIALIGLLASLLLPVLARAKRAAKTGACLSNLHQIALAMELYIQENGNRLPSCSALPSLSTSNLPPITAALGPQLQSQAVWRCPGDGGFFGTNQTSYEWNWFLNGASYDRPQDWSPATQSVVETIFGGRLNTPLIGDAEAFHEAGGIYSGKNALFFDGRVDKGKLR